MKSTAEHTHADASVCWYDWGLDGWLRYIPDDVPLSPGIIPGLAVGCPDPTEVDMIEIGDRDEALVAGDEPFTVRRQRTLPA